jgi:thiol-disulfide isomerase/thioredoxin
MDRLSAVAALCLAASACDAHDEAGAQPAVGRVDAVQGKRVKLSELCDVAPDPAAPFHWPELTRPASAQTGSKYRWVNVWATWCKPCVEELPLLSRSFADWQKKQQPLTLTLLSVDSDAAAADSFIAARPELPATLRVQDASAAAGWLTGMGLSASSAIPVHLVLDAQDKLLCARSGGISAQDLDRFHRALFP